MLIFFASFFTTQPRYNEDSRNEKILLSKRVFFAIFLVLTEDIYNAFYNDFAVLAS